MPASNTGQPATTTVRPTGRNPPTPDLNLDFRSNRRDVRAHVAQTNRHRWIRQLSRKKGSAGHFTDPNLFTKNLETVPGNTRPSNLKTDKFPGNPFGFLFLECFKTDKLFLVPTNRPAQTGFQRCRPCVQIRSSQGQTGFQP